MGQAVSLSLSLFDPPLRQPAIRRKSAVIDGNEPGGGGESVTARTSKQIIIAVSRSEKHGHDGETGGERILHSSENCQVQCNAAKTFL